MANKPNWANQTIWTGDNLDIMRGMNSAAIGVCVFGWDMLVYVV